MWLFHDGRKYFCGECESMIINESYFTACIGIIHEGIEKEYFDIYTVCPKKVGKLTFLKEIVMFCFCSYLVLVCYFQKICHNSI